MDTAHLIAADFQRMLLPADKIAYYGKRIMDLQAALLALEFVGAPEQISIAIGTFHLIKGKIETFIELLDDHAEAAQHFAATN